MKYFVNNEFITKLSEAVTHRTNNLPPHQHFWYLQKRSLEKGNVGNLHTAGFPHADVPYPTVKVFLYLNDVNEDNAAYIFAKGSHKLSLKRLLFEYKLSVVLPEQEMILHTKKMYMILVMIVNRYAARQIHCSSQITWAIITGVTFQTSNRDRLPSLISDSLKHGEIYSLEKEAAYFQKSQEGLLNHLTKQ